MTSTPAAARPCTTGRRPLDPDAAISIRGLVKRYGDFVAVDGLDLDIRRGEIFALLGPNGAGKTTTVEICEGYRARDAGEVRVLGEDPADGARALEGAAGHRAAVRRRRQPADRAASCCSAQASYYPDPRDPDEVLELVGLTEKAGVRGPDRSPVGSAAGSTSPWASSAGRRCCSSTSRPPASTRRPAGSSGR